MIHTASASQKPATSGDSPMSGMPSVVNEKMPLIPRSTRASGARRAGTMSRAQAHDSAKASGVKSSTDGICAASAGWRMAAGSMGIGVCPYAPTPSRSTCSRKYRSRSWARTIGWTSSRSGAMPWATTSGRTSVQAYWWASGWRGTGMPTIAPMRGPQMPAAHTTMSASISPWSVMTARTRPSSVRMPVTVVSPSTRAPPSIARRAWASEMRTGLVRPSVGTW